MATAAANRRTAPAPRGGASSSRRSGRRHAGLDEAKIIGAAVDLIRRSGVAALSMRSLARALGVVPMSIYHHIPNKEVLLDRVVDFILAPIPTPAPRREAWAEQIKAYTMASWEALGSCPGLSEHALKRSTPSPGSQRLWRHALAILREAGFDEAMAALCVTTYHTYVFGLLMMEGFFADSAAARARKPNKRKRKPEPKPKRDAARDNPLARLSARAWMEYGIDTALAGLRHQLERAPTLPTAKIFEPAR